MKNYQVLIVEDERRIARFLQMELEHEGMNTAIEDNGRRAYERIVQGNYDLVLLDVMLPDMDGFTICRKVRELSRQESQREAKVGQEEILSVKNLIMYPARHEVQVDGTPVELTKKEYDLLEYLLRNKRNVLTRDQILSNVWDYDYMGDTNVVDVYIRYLRQKLDDRFQEKYIHTMRGVGYVIKD